MKTSFCFFVLSVRHLSVLHAWTIGVGIDKSSIHDHGLKISRRSKDSLHATLKKDASYVDTDRGRNLKPVVNPRSSSLPDNTIIETSNNNNDRMVHFHAHLPVDSPYWSVLKQQIRTGAPESTIRIGHADRQSHGVIQFALSSKNLKVSDAHEERGSPGVFRPFWLHQLAADKLTIAAFITTTTTTEDEPLILQRIRNELNASKDAIQDTLGIWRSACGLDKPAEGTRLTFSVTHRSEGRSTGRRRRENRLENDRGLSFIGHATTEILASHPFHWMPAGRGQAADVPLHLTKFTIPRSNNETATKTCLKLTALTRLYPLNGGVNSIRTTAGIKLKHPSLKRLESFLVARALGIEPGDVVLDPSCGRGTMLIEAAKYWPLARAFIGMDTNVGHLDHARMNADSTRTSLLLLLRTPGQHQQQKLTSSFLTNVSGLEFVNKLVTCLEFGQSEHYYQSFVEDWWKLMHTASEERPSDAIRRRMVLLVDQASVHVLLEAIHAASASNSDVARLATRHVRPLLWGNERAAIVVTENCADAEKERSSSLMKAPRVGKFDWEIDSSRDNHDNILAELRSKTLPWMVSWEQEKRQGSIRNKVLCISNGKPLNG